MAWGRPARHLLCLWSILMAAAAPSSSSASEEEIACQGLTRTEVQVDEVREGEEIAFRKDGLSRGDVCRYLFKARDPTNKGSEKSRYSEIIYKKGHISHRF